MFIKITLTSLRQLGFDFLTWNLGLKPTRLNVIFKMDEVMVE
jgi:hypothetical protein